MHRQSKKCRHSSRKQSVFLLLFLVSFFFPALQGTVRAEIVDTVFMQAIIRDFTRNHYDFQDFKYVGSWTGCIEPRISTDDDSSDVSGDERGPRLKEAGCPHITSKKSFSPWYNTSEWDFVNRAFLIEIPFQVDDKGLLTYTNYKFFPLDKGEKYVSLNDPPLEPFHDDWGLDEAGEKHNYWFTTEFHASFTYRKGTKQIFIFRGDDDVYVFINDSLVIELGGIHKSLSGSVVLDSLPEGFLKDGETYPFDFFHAERCTQGSVIQITTSIRLIPRRRTKVLKAKVRDIHEDMHPDFNPDYNCDGRGRAQPKIGTDGDVSPFPGDTRTPVIVPEKDDSCLHSVENFEYWYNDRDTSIVRPFWYDIVMNEVEPGIWGYHNTLYFPLDPDSAWIPFYPDGPSPFGTTEGFPHNYGFTTEIHTLITYYEGAGQFFVFYGDDDVWAYINDSLVMDLAGIHTVQTDTIYLDSFPKGYLEDGQQYPFDFFHAERRISESNMGILTNFRFDTYEVEGIASEISYSNSSDYLELYAREEMTVNSDTLFIQIYDDSKTDSIDMVTITLSGPGGETENIQLTETREKSGTYRGYVIVEEATTPLAGNGILELGTHKLFDHIYNDANSADTIRSTRAIPSPSQKRPAPLFPDTDIRAGHLFRPATSGTLTLYKTNGTVLFTLHADKNQTYTLPQHLGPEVILFSWQGKNEYLSGKRLLVR